MNNIIIPGIIIILYIAAFATIYHYDKVEAKQKHSTDNTKTSDNTKSSTSSDSNKDASAKPAPVGEPDQTHVKTETPSTPGSTLATQAQQQQQQQISQQAPNITTCNDGSVVADPSNCGSASSSSSGSSSSSSHHTSSSNSKHHNHKNSKCPSSGDFSTISDSSSSSSTCSNEEQSKQSLPLQPSYRWVSGFIFVLNNTKSNKEFLQQYDISKHSVEYQQGYSIATDTITSKNKISQQTISNYLDIMRQHYHNLTINKGSILSHYKLSTSGGI